MISTKIHNFQIGDQVVASIREKIQVAEQDGEIHLSWAFQDFGKDQREHLLL